MTTTTSTLEQPADTAKPAAKRGAMFWVGWVLTVLISLMLAMGGVMNLMGAEQAVEGLKMYGYPPGAAMPLGVAVLVSTVLYLIPQTAVLGAILLTGWLGGAVNTHVRAGEPFIIAAVVLYFRDARVRALVPLRSAA